MSENIPIDTLSDRIKHVVQSCFQGKRLVVFSGGASKDKESLLKEVKELYLGGANGSIVGRNSFQRPYDEALYLLNQITNIYRGK
jgi:class I fructose-bisphosphate aldolase